MYLQLFIFNLLESQQNLRNMPASYRSFVIVVLNRSIDFLFQGYQGLVAGLEPRDLHIIGKQSFYPLAISPGPITCVGGVCVHMWLQKPEVDVNCLSLFSPPFLLFFYDSFSVSSQLTNWLDWLSRQLQESVFLSPPITELIDTHDHVWHLHVL